MTADCRCASFGGCERETACETKHGGSHKLSSLGAGGRRTLTEKRSKKSDADHAACLSRAVEDSGGESALSTVDQVEHCRIHGDVVMPAPAPMTSGSTRIAGVSPCPKKARIRAPRAAASDPASMRGASGNFVEPRRRPLF